MAKILIENGADVNKKDKIKRSALMVMLYFSAQCRFSIFITNYFEKLILNYLTFVMFFQAAAVGGNVDLIKLLVVKGADVYAENEVCKYH